MMQVSGQLLNCEKCSNENYVILELMKRLTAIVNWQTLLVICLSFLSCYLTITYKFTLYADFLIFGLLIAFPITLTTKEAFKRRERAMQYLSVFKASLQSLYYGVLNSKCEYR